MASARAGIYTRDTAGDPKTEGCAMATMPKSDGQTGKLKYIPWNSVELEDLNPLLQRQMVVGEKMMLARVLLKKGCVVPLHSHENEQITYILEGALKFELDGRDIVVGAGE